MDRNPSVTAAIDAANLPEIIAETTGNPCPPRGGTIHDPRPGYEERGPSFSVYEWNGVWFYRRRGAGADSGTAWHFLLSLGWTEADASAYLLGHAPGLTPAPSAPRPLSVPSPLERAAARNATWTPLTPPDIRAAWRHVGPHTPDTTRALHARGLAASPVLQSGAQERAAGYARPGALTFGVHDPRGQLVAVKSRNPAGSVPKYALHTKGRGSPPWCSPGYGRAGTLLIVEGELNAAAAAHTAHVTGLDIDVQGLPGLDTCPFLDGMDRHVILYFDFDPGHENTQERLTTLAIACGAPRVDRLPPLPPGLDFCDILATQGPHALAALLSPDLPLPTLSTAQFQSRYDTWPLMPPRSGGST